jgi:single-strand DNA-binding protein
MSQGVNKVTLKGFLGKDVELRWTGSGPNARAVATFSLATTESWKDAQGEKQERTDWHNVTVWGKQGENVAKYLKKGSSALVFGRIQYSSVDKPGGHKAYFTNIVAEDVHFLDRGAGSGRPAGEDPGQRVRGGDASDFRPPATNNGPPHNGPTNEDIPF